METEQQELTQDEAIEVSLKCGDDLKYLYQKVLLAGHTEYQEAINGPLHDYLFDFLRWDELGNGATVHHTDLCDHIPDGGLVRWIYWPVIGKPPVVYDGDEHELGMRWKKGDLIKGVLIRIAGTGHNKYVLLPRGHLKTEIAHVAFALQEIIRDPSVRIMSKTHIRDLATEVLQRVKDAWELESFARYFGGLKPELKEASWNERYIQVRAPRRGVGHTVEASAVEVETVGKHPDVIILDDVIGFENLNKKDKVRQHVQTLSFLLGGEGRVLGIGTRYAPDDPHGLFLDHGTELFKSTSFMFATLTDEAGESTWKYMTPLRIDRLRQRCVDDFLWYCFPGETLIHTERGPVRIDEVRRGDKVLTHMGRYREVEETSCRIGNTITLKGQGHTGLRVTAEHPFLSSKRGWQPNGKRKWIDPVVWTPAGEMAGRAWASPCKFPPSEIPPVVTKNLKEHKVVSGRDLMWIAGRWVGDGSIHKGTKKDNYVPRGLIISSEDDKDAVRDIVDACGRAGLSCYVKVVDKVARCVMSSSALARWMVDNFGQYSEGKYIPSWIYGLSEDLRRAFYDGYLASDGCVVRGRDQFTTINKKLAIGTKMLANSLGMSASISRYGGGGTSVIRGRLVRRNPFYIVHAGPTGRSSFVVGDHRYGLVRSVSPGCEEHVYNLQVADDNSYVADGIVCHNCQMYNNPYQVESQRLKPEWWRTWPRAEDMEHAKQYEVEGKIAPEALAEALRLDICITLDPASSTRKRSDYSACIVQGQTTDREFRYVLDGFREKLSRDDLPGRFIDLVEHWHHIARRSRCDFRVAVEGHGLATYLIYPLKDEMRKRGFWVDIKELKSQNRHKNDRIYRLASPYSLGTVLFPESLPKNGYDLIDILKHQYMHFPRGGDGEDDLLDAQAYQEDLLIPRPMSGDTVIEKRKCRPANDVIVEKEEGDGGIKGLYVPPKFRGHNATGHAGRWVPGRFRNG